MPHRDPSLPISLFLPFYTPKDRDRAAELLDCLKRNLDCGAFAGVYLLQDDDTPRPFDNDRLHVIRLARRPTYLDWVRQTRLHCPGHITVLANSDIWFDAGIALLRDIMANDAQAFVALSRYDAVSGALQPHDNPHWSQDTWAYHAAQDISPAMARQLDFPLGLPRCDNKIAYVFSVNGFTLYNPFHAITSVHQHETNLRYYDKTGDTSIVGGMAMVHPGATLTSPAAIEIKIWSLNTKQYQSVQINNALERWAVARHHKTEAQQGVFGYDADWQYPAITEQHAFSQMKALLPPEGNHEGTVYIGFPWATMVDLKRQKVPQADRLAKLNAALADIAARTKGARRVITVCQHIRMRQFPDILTAAGVTDVYWTHAVRDQPTLPDAPGITLHPFPLYPVQQTHVALQDLDRPRPHLFSFIGAGPTDIYLTQSRNWILDQLADDPRGVVIRRETWHYNKIVYEKQIKNVQSADIILVDNAASVEFQQMMGKTVFSLCPSGSGPNSIRLWEAMVNGSIPAVLADTYRHPGDDALWDMATVHCAETPEAIRALPDRLSAIAADPDLLHRKRLALYLLAQTYGPNRFVHDILAQMRPASEAPGQ
jgi:hypothetical protein